MDEATALVYLKRWFIDPIDKLKELEAGDGGWVAFIVGIALYQRLIEARLKLRNEKPTPEAIGREAERDLQLTEEQRKIFWVTFRIGLMHQAMPKAGKTEWAFSHRFSAYPTFVELPGDSMVICVDPWKFTDRVLREFHGNPKLFIASDSFPMAMVGSLSPDLFDAYHKTAAT